MRSTVTDHHHHCCFRKRWRVRVRSCSIAHPPLLLLSHPQHTALIEEEDNDEREWRAYACGDSNSCHRLSQIEMIEENGGSGMQRILPSPTQSQYTWVRDRGMVIQPIRDHVLFRLLLRWWNYPWQHSCVIRQTLLLLLLLLLFVSRIIVDVDAFSIHHRRCFVSSLSSSSPSLSSAATANLPSMSSASSSWSELIRLNGNTNDTTTTATLSSSSSSLISFDMSMPTERGGFTHTLHSRRKIAAANRGKTPWNKGVPHTEAVKQRIAAGVRKRNHERFLAHIAALNLTETEYHNRQAAVKAQAQAEKQARRTERGGYRPSNATKAKISRILKEKYALGLVTKPRKISPAKVRRGFSHSNETRAKIAESLRRRWANDPEYRANMMIKTAAKLTVDVGRRERISKTLKAKWQDPEFRAFMMAKISTGKESAAGAQSQSQALDRPPKAAVKLDDSHRQRISKAMKAKWQDESYRAKALEAVAKKRDAMKGERRRNEKLPRSKKAVSSVSSSDRTVPPGQHEHLQVQRVQPRRKSHGHDDIDTHSRSRSDAAYILTALEPLKKAVPLRFPRNRNSDSISTNQKLSSTPSSSTSNTTPSSSSTAITTPAVQINESHHHHHHHENSGSVFQLTTDPNQNAVAATATATAASISISSKVERILNECMDDDDESLDDFDPYGLQDC